MTRQPEMLMVPVCESCWLHDHTTWSPESMDEYGNIIMRMTDVTVPETANLGIVEVCGLCGGMTVVGIYELRETSGLYFEDSDDDEYELGIGDIDED